MVGGGFKKCELRTAGVTNVSASFVFCTKYLQFCLPVAASPLCTEQLHEFANGPRGNRCVWPCGLRVRKETAVQVLCCGAFKKLLSLMVFQ